jgi:hypothetical protein
VGGKVLVALRDLAELSAHPLLGGGRDEGADGRDLLLHVLPLPHRFFCREGGSPPEQPEGAVLPEGRGGESFGAK